MPERPIQKLYFLHHSIQGTCHRGWLCFCRRGSGHLAEGPRLWYVPEPSTCWSVNQRLLSDYLDLYLIHSPPSGTELRLETYKALLDAKKAGKLRDVGVSN